MNVNTSTAASWEKLQERFRRDRNLAKMVNSLDAVAPTLEADEKSESVEHAYLPYATDPTPIEPEWK